MSGLVVAVDSVFRMSGTLYLIEIQKLVSISILSHPFIA